MHKAVVGVLAAAVVLAVAVFGWLWWRDADRTPFERAVAAAPADAERLSWTDWAGVRRELGTTVDAGSSDGELTAFLDAAYDADLSSRSALLESASRLQASYGFSPASVEWELFSQSGEGAVIVLGLPESADFDRLADRLADLGYSRPGDEDGVWGGGPDLVSQIDPSLTPELSYVVLDADEHLVLTSDQQGYLETVVGHRDGVADLDTVAEGLGEPMSAAVYSGDYACGALAMAQAGADDQAEASELVAAAGTVDPYRAFAMAALPGGGVRVVMSFADDDQARTNAESRAVLASGPAVGQGGDFADRFALDSARADGSLVTLDLDPVDGAYVLSDLTSGPVLFATC